MNEKDRQFVLDNVDNINADVRDIDELCCALEHSTIFAVDYIQTFATRLIDLDYKYKNLQSKIDKAIEYVSSLSSKGRDCEIYYDIKKEILDILKEDK